MDFTGSLTSDQKIAFDAIVQFLAMDGGGFHVLSGFAGTGKTFLMGRVLEHINHNSQKRVALTAPTHKAIKVLASFAETDDLFTTHAYLGMIQKIDNDGNQVFKPGNGYNVPCHNFQITIVDEASMVADEIFDELEDLVLGGHKVIFVGDSLQIPPVNQKNSLPFEVPVQRELNFSTSNFWLFRLNSPFL